MSQKNKESLNPLVVAGAVEKKRKKMESKFDPNKLRNLIKESKTAKEIMEVMNINHKQVLKHFLLKLMVIDNCLYNIQGLYNQQTRKAYMNAKGSIIIKNNMIDFKSLVLEPDKTEFDVEVDDSRKQIILTVIDHHPVISHAESELNIESAPNNDVKEA